MTAIEAPAAAKAFRLEREGELGVLWFDLPGEKVNKLSSTVVIELDGLLDEIASSGLKQLVIASGKPSIFIAGADVTEFTRVESAAQAEEFVKFGQKVLTKLADLPQVTVAAINGACVGGGLELAINCDYRVASDSPKTTFSFPEVKLGIIPAWTGTTRFPRLVGLPTALDMILTGKSLDSKRARRAGFVDEIAPSSIVIAAARQFARSAKGKRSGSDRTKLYLEGNPVARRFVFSKARSSVIEKTGGHYPAPLKAIEVMATSFSRGEQAGLDAEARAAAELITGDIAGNLVQLFFLMEDSKKDPLAPLAREVRNVGVLGAGVMGGGIAQLVVDKADTPVRMKDINWDALSGGMRAAAKLWRKKVERRRMTRGEMSMKLSRITTTVDWSGFRDADLAIEAVVENLGIKQKVLGEFEAVAREDAIFASNTSTLPITRIAASAQRPENVVGMHFFNPVDRMPLVEVIRGEKSSDQAVATVAALARRLGKTVVHCNDAPGFVVNRILGPYMNEAAFLLEEGNSIDSVDKAMTRFGMPMGPFALLDEVGIDVAAKAGQVLVAAFPQRLTSPAGIHKLLESGRLGKKNGRGVYLWKEGKRTSPDPEVYTLLGISTAREGDEQAMVERMVYAMVNEASVILDEGVVASAPELDLAMIMGTGFPPFRGGLLRYADKVGIEEIVLKLEGLERSAGPRFSPSEPLRRLAREGGTFYSAYPAQRSS
jgi:3-hydroxyacyl-CoA dehydrogenase / enoyl-CoA hydratase / 3-hydroxybutyryl-CoA epimerase